MFFFSGKIIVINAGYQTHCDVVSAPPQSPRHHCSHSLHRSAGRFMFFFLQSTRFFFLFQVLPTCIHGRSIKHVATLSAAQTSLQLQVRKMGKMFAGGLILCWYVAVAVCGCRGLAQGGILCLCSGSRRRRCCLSGEGAGSDRCTTPAPWVGQDVHDYRCARLQHARCPI